MKTLWDSGVGFFEVDIETAHELAMEIEEPWRYHGPYAFEVVYAPGETPGVTNSGDR